MRITISMISINFLHSLLSGYPFESGLIVANINERNHVITRCTHCAERMVSYLRQVHLEHYQVWIDTARAYLHKLW